MIAQQQQSRPATPEWIRRYPPLAAVAVAVILAAYALPSSLNLPQANPGQVAEYAPVPGNSNAAPQGGNFAGLSLGQGGAPQGGGAPGTAPLPGQTVPTTFSCVGNPPRQTQDPLSPPCVPAFNADNGGATYQGVTGNSVTILVHFHLDQGGCYSGVAATNNCAPADGYYDMSKASDANAFFMFQDISAWQHYFNNHYQTYKRFVHFIAFNSSLSAADSQTYNNNNGWGTCSDGEADAARNYKDEHPFAVLDEYGGDVSYGDAARVCYRNYMVQHNVLIFGGQVTWLRQSFYSQFHGLVWEFAETIDRISQLYASFLCTRLAGKPVSFASQYNGQQRKFGIITYEDSAKGSTYTDWRDIVQADIKQQCGVVPAMSATYPVYQAWQSSGSGSSQVLQDMVNFHNAGITTIIFLGASGDDANAASQIGYAPEWVDVGDDINDSSLFAVGMPPNEEANTITVTQQPLQNADGQPVEPACYQAITEVYPNIPRDTLDIPYACLFFYDDFRQLFTGIQVAGPRLTPSSIDEGFHAIPPHPSPGPEQPACFYPAGDYTCFKDAVLEYWDPNAQPAQQCAQACNRSGSYANGCWRMWRGGFRYLPGQWPSGDAKDGASTSTDICNLYLGGTGGFAVTAPSTG